MSRKLLLIFLCKNRKKVLRILVSNIFVFLLTTYVTLPAIFFFIFVLALYTFCRNAVIMIMVVRVHPLDVLNTRDREHGDLLSMLTAAAVSYYFLCFNVNCTSIMRYFFFFQFSDPLMNY